MKINKIFFQMKLKDLINKHYYISNHGQFFSFLIILLFLSYNSLSKSNERNLNNFDSQITLIIQGTGEKSFLYEDYSYEPTEVIINNITKTNCQKSCDMEREENTVILKFTGQILTCEKMFYEIRYLKEIDLSSFSFAEATNISQMFYKSTRLTSINFGNLKTSNVKDMSWLFSYTNISSIDLSKFDTSLVTDMSYMFVNCGSIISIDVSHFNTSNVKNMRSMFNRCSQLVSIDISNFDTSKVTSMGVMFYGCSELKNINFGNIDTSSIDNLVLLFQGCSKLESVDLSVFNKAKITSMAKMFDGCSNLKFIDLSNFDTSKVTNMTYMFNNCTNLEKIIFGKINTTLVDDMSYLFNNCPKLISIDLYNFDTINVKYMQNMFYNCKSLTSIDISNFNLQNVISIYSIFCNCENLLTINLPNFTSNANNYSYIFKNCKNLKYLNLSTFSPNEINSIQEMFYGCDSLIYLNLYSFIMNDNTETTNIFNSNIPDLKICINDNTQIIQTLLSSYGKTSQCNNNCFTNNMKLDVNNKECIDSCNTGFNFEYNSICYEECPENTIISPNNDKICENNFCKYFYINKDLCPQKEGYYLDLNDGIYKNCYNTCKFCKGTGDKTKNNCTQCAIDYMFLDEPGHTINCYQKCQYYYYFDEFNNYNCTENMACPEKYKNIIFEKNKCVDECKNDDIYIYEYNNICYKNCPNETIINESDNICYNKQIIDSTIIFPLIPSSNIQNENTENNMIEEKKSSDIITTNINKPSIISHSTIKNSIKMN